MPLVDACLSPCALNNGITAQGMYHGIGFVVGEGCQSVADVLQHFDKDAAQPTEHDMPELIFVLSTQE